MFRSSRTAGVRNLLIAAAAAALLASGCEAGNSSPTLNWHQPTDGSTAAAGSTTIADVFVLGAPVQASLPAGGSAGLFFGLASNGSGDTLLGISAPGTAAAVQLPSGPVTVPAKGTVVPVGSRPAAVLQNLTNSLPGGAIVKIVMTFRTAGSITIDVPVMPRAQYYSTFSPPAASPTASASPGHRHGTGSPSPGASRSPSPSPSASH